MIKSQVLQMIKTTVDRNDTAIYFSVNCTHSRDREFIVTKIAFQNFYPPYNKEIALCRNLSDRFETKIMQFLKHFEVSVSQS